MPDTDQGIKKMADSKNYLAPLGLAVVGAIFGIGHFSGLHKTLFGSDNKTEYVSESYYANDYDDSYSSGYNNGEIAFKGAPDNETYTRTSNSVSIYTESGSHKGVFAVYLHHGDRYIDFNNTWICIQGKSRFGYRGNWYVIK